MYIIGLYNEKVDNPSNLSNCDIVFNNYDNLKKHIRNGDTVKLSSQFSLFGIPAKDIIKLQEEKNISFVINNDTASSDGFKTFHIHTTTAINDFILSEKETILKLLS